MTATLWQHGLKPRIQCLQLADQSATTLKQAVERTVRREYSSRDDRPEEIECINIQLPDSKLDQVRSSSICVYDDNFRYNCQHFTHNSIIRTNWQGECISINTTRASCTATNPLHASNTF